MGESEVDMNRVHIFGASGSGTTTLGEVLSPSLSTVHFDTDDYYWQTKYSEKRDIKDRKKLLRNDLMKHNDWILTGSLCGWGDEFITEYDLVIYLWVPPKIRLERLRQREFQRYGRDILVGGDRYEQYMEFIEWASQYDKGGMEVRSKHLHEQWMSKLSCPVLKIEGNHTVEERVDIVLDYLS